MGGLDLILLVINALILVGTLVVFWWFIYKDRVAVQCLSSTPEVCSEAERDIVCRANPSVECKNYCLQLEETRSFTCTSDLFCMRYIVDMKNICSPCAIDFFSVECKQAQTLTDYCYGQAGVCAQECLKATDANERCAQPFCAYDAPDVCNPCALLGWSSEACARAPKSVQEVYCSTLENPSVCEKSCYASEGVCLSYEYCTSDMCNVCSIVGLEDAACHTQLEEMTDYCLQVDSLGKSYKSLCTEWCATSNQAPKAPFCQTY